MSVPDSSSEEGASLQYTRRARSACLTVTTILLCLMPAAARAESPADSVQVVLNGRPLSFDVPPVIEQNVTMVPVRAVLTPLGATFAWDQEAMRVTALLYTTRIDVVVGESTAQVNERDVPLPMPVMNRDGRTLIPLRFFAEALGFGVQWEAETRTVMLQSQEPEPGVSRQASRRTGDLVLVRALEQIGAGYSWGGTRPETGFDCSGFVTYLSLAVGQEVPRTSEELFAAGVPIADEDLVAGDLVFFTTYAPGASHVGVYDGEGGFIHAQSPEVGVVRTPLSRAYWSERYLGARRIFR